MTSPISVSSLFSVTAPSKPLNVQPFCDVIAWGRPIATNGKITGYEVLFTFLPGGTTVIARVEGDITHYVMNITQSANTMRIEVFIFLYL